jgi:acyl-CoA synthetase (AMP-forming)/AMP-acid ligase II
MHAGATLLCEEAFEPGRTLDMLERERATIAVGWAHYAKRMAEHPSFGSRDLSSLHGGNLWAILPEAIRPRDPELRSNSLGMTETCGPHTLANMDDDLPESLRGSFGSPVPDFEHRIVDPDTGATLAPGHLGEICIRGPSVMQGLYKMERSAVFDADGFYHTGDAGWFDADGVLFFTGRLGEMIKTGGANVTPREVETALLTLPGVKEAYVAGVPDAERGERVVAVVVPQTGHELDVEAILAALRNELASYKVPRELVVARTAELPFTDTGKIDRKRLRAWLIGRLGRPGDDAGPAGSR